MQVAEDIKLQIEKGKFCNTETEAWDHKKADSITGVVDGLEFMATSKNSRIR